MNIRIMALTAFLAITNVPVNAEDIQRSPIWLKKPIKHDWLQLTSGEWLKGDIHSLYNDVLTFDSDKLGIQEIDWDDIDVLKSSQEMTVLLSSGAALKGILTVAKEVKCLLSPTVLMSAAGAAQKSFQSPHSKAGFSQDGMPKLAHPPIFAMVIPSKMT